MSEHLYTYINPPNERHLQAICQLLKNDGLIAIPTDTNWAFCCAATSRKAQQRIALIKPNRPVSQPFSLLCTDISMASTITKIGHKSYRLLKQVWPGPYTIILKSGPQFPKRLKNKRETVGIRIPNEVITLEIIRAYGEPLIATSIPALDNGTTLNMGYEVFEQYGHCLDLVVDIGEELPGTETTIFDFTRDDIELLRTGAGDPDILGIVSGNPQMN